MTKKINEIITKSLLIGLGAVIIDQLYHIALRANHQIFTILTDPSTKVYIGSKFVLVFLVGFIILNIGVIRNKFLQSSIIAAVAAFMFSIILTYLFPGQYGIFMHMSHALAIFASSLIVLFFIKKD